MSEVSALSVEGKWLVSWLSFVLLKGLEVWLDGKRFL